MCGSTNTCATHAQLSNPIHIILKYYNVRYVVSFNVTQRERRNWHGLHY